MLADLSVIDHSLEGTQQTLLPDMLGAARVSVLSPEAGTLSTAEVSFTTSNVLPGDGYISPLHPTPYTLHLTPYTPPPKPQTPNPKPQTSNPTSQTPNPKP